MTSEKIKMVKLNSNSVAVDEISDVKKAKKILKKFKKLKLKVKIKFFKLININRFSGLIFWFSSFQLRAKIHLT